MEAVDLLQVRELTKHFGRVRAVDGLDFSLKSGRTLAVVGESGCGKTTTARLILRLEQPSSGEVLVDGENVHALHGGSLRRFRMRVQAVFQDPWSSLNPRKRVRSIIAEP